MYKEDKIYYATFIVILSAFTYCETLNSQNTLINGKIYSLNSKSPLPYVNLNINGSDKYFDSDSLGNFSLNLSEFDSINFNCIGYKKIKKSVKDLIIDPDVYLVEEIHELSPLIINTGNKFTIGNIDIKQTSSFSGDSNSNSYEIALKLELPTSVDLFKLEKILFKQRKYSSERPIRLHVYSVDKNGLPGNELLSMQIVSQKKNHSNGILEFDISNQNIIIDKNSVFIGIQWIYPTNMLVEKIKGIRNDTGIGETTVNQKILTFRRGGELDHNWFVMFEKGVYIPIFEALQMNSKPIPIEGNPINLIASVKGKIL